MLLTLKVIVSSSLRLSMRERGDEKVLRKDKHVRNEEGKGG